MSCEYSFDDEKLFCCLLNALIPNCTRIPNQFDYTNVQIRVKCKRCPEILYIRFESIGETASYNEFHYTVRRESGKNCETVDLIEEAKYRKSLIRDVKEFLACQILFS